MWYLRRHDVSMGGKRYAFGKECTDFVSKTYLNHSESRLQGVSSRERWPCEVADDVATAKHHCQAQLSVSQPREQEVGQQSYTKPQSIGQLGSALAKAHIVHGSRRDRVQFAVLLLHYQRQRGVRVYAGAARCLAQR